MPFALTIFRSERAVPFGLGILFLRSSELSLPFALNILRSEPFHDHMEYRDEYFR